jgi:hypothetical protein
MITDDSRVLIGRSRFWHVELEGHAQRARAAGLCASVTSKRPQK